MKSILFILALALTVSLSAQSTQSDCYKNYAPAIEKIDNIYKKTQYKHSLAYKDHYIYEIFPTTLYPFFMINPDTLKKLPQYGIIYLCQNTTIGLHLDKNDNKHIQIAVLQYTKTYLNSLPGIKLYILHYYKYDQNTKNWIEERSPIIVTLSMKKDSTYYSK
jgi:hypothetical protein